MTLAAELAFEDLARGGAHPLGPGEQIVDTELAIGAMLRWPMRLDGYALIAASGSRMGSDQGAALEDLDRMSAEARIDALADQGVVDGVIGPADFDMMILVDAGADLPCPSGKGA
jgi:hypothetical protein